MDSAPPDPVSAEDIALFRESVGPVRRVRDRPRRALAPPSAAPASRPAPDFASALAQHRETETVETGEELLHLRPGLPQALLRRLRRGHYAVRDELDLHSLDAPTAAALLKRFLDEARREGRWCVKIIHGKGRRSRGSGPVLRGLVDRLLRLRGDVLAFAPARPAQGGSGATLVLLAPRRGGRTRAATRPRSA